MTCTEARQYLFAFLDNELDAPVSIEVQCHLEKCPECARECEIERVIGKQLGAVLQAGAHGPTPDVESDFDAAMRYVFDRPAAESSAPTRRRKRWLVPLSAVSVLGIAAASLLVWSARGTHPPRFVDLLVDDFEHFQEKGRPLQIASSEPDVVSEWLARQTALAVTLPPVHEAGGKLLGARKCKINGKPAAFAVYELKDTIASLVVLPASENDLKPMTRVQKGERVHWLDRCRGHTVLACRRGALVYAAVSSLPEERLLCLMPSPPRG
jgi:anti-sigma factor RsiW